MTRAIENDGCEEPFHPSLAVVAALREEVAPLLRRLRHRRVSSEDGGVRVVGGFLGRVPLALACSGAGVRNAERGARTLLRAAPGVPLLGIGVGGALSPELRAGDLVIGEWIREGAMALDSSAEWVARAHRAGARAGSVETVDEVITAAARKRELWERLGRPEAAVVDMESSRWGAVALAEGRSFLVVRAVSDEAGEDLPSYLATCRDEGGGLDRGRVLRRLLGRPSSLGALLRLRRRLQSCSGALAALVAELTAELPPASAPRPPAGLELEEAS